MSEIIGYRALDSKVLCVAVKRVEGAWCAYIAAVPGESHQAELEDAKNHGNKLPEDVALAVFPQFKEAGLSYAW